MAHGRVNTYDILQTRIPHSCFSPHWCALGKAKGQSVDHVFDQGAKAGAETSLIKKLFP